MNTETFWTLIEDSLDHSPGHAERGRYLTARLAELSAEEIPDFQALVDNLCVRADRWDLWGAAARILGGFCSDDGFEYFRLWLIGRGRKVFEPAVADPDSLAEAPEVQRLIGRRPSAWDDDAEYPSWESLAYLAAEAYASVTGEEDEDAFDDAVAQADVYPAPLPDYLAEQHWSASDEAAAAVRIPRLARAFPLPA
ncbi:MAG TPA: DUF4240 domain-containing protein [Actinospica sp.]|nr:DUF4240 domain-containing protein [Actinospica sp.]